MRRFVLSVLKGGNTRDHRLGKINHASPDREASLCFKGRVGPSDEIESRRTPWRHALHDNLQTGRVGVHSRSERCHFAPLSPQLAVS